MIKINDKQINIEKFPNNEIRIRDLDYQNNATIELKYESSDDLIALIFLKKAFDERGLNTNLFIWYMPYSRMDREFENDLFMLKYITQIINDLNFSKVYVLEPHSSTTEQLLKNVVAIYPMDTLVTSVQTQIGFTENDHIVFPDAGSFKRYGANQYENILTFQKRRDEASTNIKTLYLDQGTVNPNSKCIIIDDLCSTGNTCYKVGNILKEHGAKEVYVLVVHTENQSLKKPITENNSPIDTIYTTDSLITEEHPKVKILEFNPKEYIKGV